MLDWTGILHELKLNDWQRSGKLVWSAINNHRDMTSYEVYPCYLEYLKCGSCNLGIKYLSEWQKTKSHKQDSRY